MLFALWLVYFVHFHYGEKSNLFFPFLHRKNYLALITEFTVRLDGIYFVKVEGETFKVIVR